MNQVEKNNLPLISVVVPVYNVEKYVARCLDSLIKQTYPNLEIIVVDDGATDSSGYICDEYSRIYPNVYVYHKSNGGLSSARNFGLKHVQGEYIGFIDSDDWVSNDYYEYLFNILRNNDAQIAQITPYLIHENEIPHDDIRESCQVYTGKEPLQFYMDYSTTTGSYSVWKFLYHNSVIEGIAFREGRINEDIDFNYLAMDRCTTLVVSNLKKYYYFQGSESISSGGLKRRDFDLYYAAEELIKLSAEESYGTIKYLCYIKKCRTAFSLLSKIAYFGIADESFEKGKIVKELTTEHRKNTFALLKSPLSFKRKVLVIMFALNYSLAKICVNIGKKMRMI